MVIYTEGRNNPPDVFAGEEFHHAIDAYARREFPERSISGIAWSPDSEFLLFTTASSGGHSPWHFKTFVFCVADKSFRDAEDVTGGAVIASEFQFETPDVAVLTVMDTAHPESRAGKKVEVPLGKKSPKMKRLIDLSNLPWISRPDLRGFVKSERHFFGFEDFVVTSIRRLDGVSPHRL